MSRCPEGTISVALSYPVENPGFDTLIKDKVRTSWGDVEFFVQEKVTPPAKVT